MERLNARGPIISRRSLCVGSLKFVSGAFPELCDTELRCFNEYRFRLGIGPATTLDGVDMPGYD